MSATAKDLPASEPRYSSLSRFYTADPRRTHSREDDIGLWWRDGDHGPLHRAAWIHDTGELYLVRLGPVEDGGGVVEVLGVVDGRECLEQLLEGWRDAVGAPNSLAWLRERAAGLRRRMRLASHAVAAATVAAASACGAAAGLA